MQPSLTVSCPNGGASLRRQRRLSSASLLCLIATIALLLGLAAGSARAAAPASVSVQVEGLTETKLPPTIVTTNTTPVIKDANPEHSCSGTSGAGALDVATGGSWGGTWFGSLGYSQETILGEVHVFDSASPANFFWAFWLNEKESSQGVCEVELQPGDRMLFFPSCYGEACPPAPLPLGIEAPAVANLGEPIVASVKRFTAGGEASPAAGATVTLGTASAVTDASGHATLAATSPGALLMRATAPESIRTEASVCVHAGDDGLCGGSAATGVAGASTSGAGGAATAYKGPFAVVARAAGLSEGHVFARGHGPRLLGGSVAAHAAVTSVTLELRRSLRGACSAFNGIRTRFERARCGSGHPFQVSTSSSFSYLLPAALARGRYVLDILASDADGNRTTLSRGTSRTVFYVR